MPQAPHCRNLVAEEDREQEPGEDWAQYCWQEALEEEGRCTQLRRPGLAGRRRDKQKEQLGVCPLGSLPGTGRPILIPRPPPSAMPPSGAPGTSSVLPFAATPQNPRLCGAPPKPGVRNLCPSPAEHTYCQSASVPPPRSAPKPVPSSPSPALHAIHCLFPFLITDGLEMASQVGPRLLSVVTFPCFPKRGCSIPHPCLTSRPPFLAPCTRSALCTPPWKFLSPKLTTTC